MPLCSSNTFPGHFLFVCAVERGSPELVYTSMCTLETSRIYAKPHLANDTFGLITQFFTHVLKHNKQFVDMWYLEITRESKVTVVMYSPN